MRQCKVTAVTHRTRRSSRTPDFGPIAEKSTGRRRRTESPHTARGGVLVAMRNRANRGDRGEGARALGFYPPSPRSRGRGLTRAKQGSKPRMALGLLTWIRNRHSEEGGRDRDDRWGPLVSQTKAWPRGSLVSGSRESGLCGCAGRGVEWAAQEDFPGGLK